MERSASLLARQAPTIRYDLHGKRQAYDGNAYNGKAFMRAFISCIQLIMEIVQTIPYICKMDEIISSINDN